MTIHADSHGFQVQASRPATTQNLAIGAASVQGTAFAATTTHIRIVATSACWVAFGANPTAAASGAGCIYVPALTPEYFFVDVSERVAVIQATAAGSLNVAELAA